MIIIPRSRVRRQRVDAAKQIIIESCDHDYCYLSDNGHDTSQPGQGLGEEVHCFPPSSPNLALSI